MPRAAAAPDPASSTVRDRRQSSSVATPSPPRQLRVSSPGCDQDLRHRIRCVGGRTRFCSRHRRCHVAHDDRPRKVVSIRVVRSVAIVLLTLLRWRHQGVKLLSPSRATDSMRDTNKPNNLHFCHVCVFFCLPVLCVCVGVSAIRRCENHRHGRTTGPRSRSSRGTPIASHPRRQERL